MMNPKYSFLVITILVSIQFTAGAQDRTLSNRSSVEFRFGLWSAAKAPLVFTYNNVPSQGKQSGVTGGVGYVSWLEEHMALTLEANVLGTQSVSTTPTKIITQTTSAVGSFLLGLRFYLPGQTTKARVRPYISGGFGPFIGFQATNDYVSAETRIETSLGGHVGAGIDFLSSRHLKIGADVGYTMMTDFEKPVGARASYNGPDFCLTCGIIF